MRIPMVVSAMVLAVLSATPVCADEGATHSITSTHMKVNGVIAREESGITTVNVPWGTIRIASSVSPKGLAVGEQVTIQVNENNTVIDIHRRGALGHTHRFLTGNLTYASPDKTEITLWTPEGDRTFDVQTGRAQLSAFEEGTPITAELNEAGNIIDLHRLTVEMSVDDRPHTKPGHVIQVNGTVQNIRSGVVFIKTPFGHYTISANRAPADAAVGDDVSLWVNEENMVIDHHGKAKHKAGVHRLIFGRLVYVGKMNDHIKLRTPEGEKTFPLERMEVKTKPIAEGSNVVVELNEEGTVIDLTKAQ
jgi:hypothetical protein